jgi:hypothetical protein
LVDDATGELVYYYWLLDYLSDSGEVCKCVIIMRLHHKQDGSDSDTFSKIKFSDLIAFIAAGRLWQAGGHVT